MHILLAFAVALTASEAHRKFPRGATPTPRHKLLAAPRHTPIGDPPAQTAYVPAKLDFWGNDEYGDCVTAEEAFCKACYEPEIFIEPQEAVRWARQHGYLHGADLASVLTTMQTDGFAVGSQAYEDGAYSSVDYSNQTVLHSAIAQGPVKIGIDADALPPTAGLQQGWYAIGTKQNYPNTDHCVALCGYGTAAYLYGQLNVPLPAALSPDAPGYLLFTWSSIGFVDHNWIMSTCAEAWVRCPSTVGVPPLTPTPAPPNPATPAGTLSFGEVVQLVLVAADTDLTDGQAAGVAAFFADETTPRVALLKQIVYRRAIRAGAIPPGTPIESVNWQGLIQFVQAMLPAIEQLMLLFGGAEHDSAIIAHVYLCSAPATCGPNGCKLAPLSPAASSENGPAAKSPTAPRKTFAFPRKNKRFFRSSTK